MCTWKREKMRKPQQLLSPILQCIFIVIIQCRRSRSMATVQCTHNIIKWTDQLSVHSDQTNCVQTGDNRFIHLLRVFECLCAVNMFYNFAKRKVVFFIAYTKCTSRYKSYPFNLINSNVLLCSCFKSESLFTHIQYHFELMAMQKKEGRTRMCEKCAHKTNALGRSTWETEVIVVAVVDVAIICTNIFRFYYFYFEFFSQAKSFEIWNSKKWN